MYPIIYIQPRLENTRSKISFVSMGSQTVGVTVLAEIGLIYPIPAVFDRLAIGFGPIQDQPSKFDRYSLLCSVFFFREASAASVHSGVFTQPRGRNPLGHFLYH